MKWWKKLAAAVAVAGVLSASMTSMAAENDMVTAVSVAGLGVVQLSIRATGIPADSVINYEGYGSLKFNGVGNIWEDDPENVIPPQTALVDRNGGAVFPYSPTYLRYRVSGGIISLTEISPYRLSNPYAKVPPSYYKPDGSAAFVLAPGEPVTTTEGYETTTTSFSWDGGLMRDGYALVVKEEVIDTSYYDGGTSIGTSHTEYHSYIVDQNGTVVCTLPEGFNDLISDGAFGYATQYNLGACGEGLFAVYFYGDETIPTECIGYMDPTGNMAIDLTGRGYTNLSSFSGGLAVVSDVNGLWGAIDHAGNQVIPCIYTDLGGFSDDGLCAARIGDQWGYIDRYNNPVIPFVYDGAYGAWGGLASVGMNGKYGFVDYANQTVVPLAYDDVSSFDNGVAYAVKDRFLYMITVQ